MSDTSTGKNSIEFIPANCPNCGGEIRVPSNRDVVRCMYCGHDVIIRDPNTITLKRKVDIEKLLAVANMAVDSNNFPEAYSYFTQALEEDPENCLALLGKGFSAGMMSTFENLRYEEARNYFKKALKPNGTNNPTEVHYAIRYLYDITNKLWEIMKERHNIDYRIRASWAFREKYTKICRDRFEIFVECYYWFFHYPLEEIPKNHILHPLESGKIFRARIKYWITYSMGEYKLAYRLLFPDIDDTKDVYDFCCLYPTEWKSDLLEDPEIIKTLKFIGEPWESRTSNNQSTAPMSNNKSTSSNKGKCFVITATMGDANHPYVRILQSFRDKHLNNTIMGKKLIAFYNRVGPSIAGRIEASFVARKLMFFIVVRPSIWVVQHFYSDTNFM